MKSPKVMDVDVHPYISPKDIADRLSEPLANRFLSGSRAPGSLGYWNPRGVRSNSFKVGPYAFDGNTLDDILHFLDLTDVSTAILNFNFLTICLSPEADFARSVLSAVNDILVEQFASKDQRLKVSLLVPLADIEMSKEEVRRFDGVNDVVQVLLPAGAPFPYGNRYYNSLYNELDNQGLAAAIHPGGHGVGIGGSATAVGCPSSYFEWHSGVSSVFVSHLASLISECTFVRYPNLRFAFLECGYLWATELAHRMDRNWSTLRGALDLPDKPPSELISEHTIFTTQPFFLGLDKARLDSLFRGLISPNVLAFSSDFPHWDGDIWQEIAQFIPRELQSLVASENARRFYKL